MKWGIQKGWQGWPHPWGSSQVVSRSSSGVQGVGAHQAKSGAGKATVLQACHRSPPSPSQYLALREHQSMSAELGRRYCSRVSG